MTYLTRAEAAGALGVSTTTIDSYIRRGILSASQAVPAGKVRIPQAEVDRLLNTPKQAKGE